MKQTSIVVKLGASMLVLVLAIVLPLGFVLNQLFANFYFNETEEELDRLSDRYAASITSLGTEQLVLFERLSSLTDRPIVVVDDEGMVVANSGVAGLPEGRRVASAELAQLTDSATRQEEYVDPVTGIRYLSIGKPIVEQDELIGAVFVLDAAEDLYQSLAAVRQSVILSATGAVLLALGFTLILSRRLSDPLVDMARAARKMAKGDLATRVAAGGHDEVGALAAAINDLAVELQQYRQNRRQFFADVSHELQTPMTYLEGYASALENKLYQTEEEQQHYIRIIRQETDRMSRLVQDLFELSKMEEGKIALVFEEVDIIEVAENAVMKTRMQAQQKGIDMIFRRPDTAPSVEADGARMEQIFTNLVDNAVKYTESGTITVTVSAQTDMMEITVADTGSGIPATDLPHVFDRFYRVEKSRSREFGGTGLGLAIVKQLTELQGGTIDVASEPGTGTRFTLRFPVRKEAAQ
ncbi:sensor histidine kinase [Planococcus lenghuensis]|uniref:histidine kinase n=1 Tax=Planococcus lenghuensis TaxID=2213202 RepID=A0A1Q2KZU1_9BACL|nr:ATP-binding protein [Planococcus lenghuensis]AQQ53337.1 hypothetical protein B0X71_09765 [Planococcus lenghuensis]